MHLSYKILGHGFNGLTYGRYISRLPMEGGKTPFGVEWMGGGGEVIFSTKLFHQNNLSDSLKK